jgi:hypothetical protein
MSQDTAGEGPKWFVVLDLSGPREQYAALFDFLGSLGARKIAPCMLTEARPRRILCPCEPLRAPVKLRSA